MVTRFVVRQCLPVTTWPLNLISLGRRSTMITICRGVQNMDDLERRLVDVETGLVALQKLQDLYDADLWAIQSPPFAKFRHIVIHITVLAGELSKLGEAWEHESHVH